MNLKSRSGKLVIFPVCLTVLTAFLSMSFYIKSEVHQSTVSNMYTDKLSPSREPPGGIPRGKTPQFVLLGFDDNGYSGANGSGGLTWLLDFLDTQNNPKGQGNPDTHDGNKVSVSFFFSTIYAADWIYESPVNIKKTWHRAMEAGHETGLHSHSHLHGISFTESQWNDEILLSRQVLTKDFRPDEPVFEPDVNAGIGVSVKDIYGWRSPFLEYNNKLFRALKKNQLVYDCSIEEGWQPDQNGTDFFWPYTLDEGSPGNREFARFNNRELMVRTPGLWEIPVYVLLAPPDEDCEKYGVPSGLRAKLKGNNEDFQMDQGKITGVDYNLWFEYGMSKDEFLAVLKYTFDQHFNGNRAPFIFLGHTDYYSGDNPIEGKTTFQERQLAIEEFISWVLSKEEVRIISHRQLIDWMNDPVSLN